MPAICVFCSASESIDERYVRLAADVGVELARRGHTLVSGGGCGSCMGAVARAARASGAHTVGVMVEGLPTEAADEDADELIIAQNMRVRKATMDARADAFLALPGGLGTLEELLEIWVSRSLGLHAKPVVALDPDGVFSLLRAQVDELVERRFVRPAMRDSLVWAASPSEALDLLDSHLAEAAPVPRATIGEAFEAQP